MEKNAQAEQAKLQEKLARARKMEAVGRLAGGVAHEFNNMLGVILGYGELALDKVAEDDPLLAVENEAAILKLAQKMLQGLGYRVLAAMSAKEAMAMAEAHLSASADAQAGAGKIDLLIIDGVMPEVNGRNLAERLKTFSPGLKVLFMSGYTADTIAHRGVLDQGVDFIQKPLTIEDLAVKVRGALN